MKYHFQIVDKKNIKNIVQDSRNIPVLKDGMDSFQRAHDIGKIQFDYLDFKTDEYFVNVVDDSIVVAPMLPMTKFNLNDYILVAITAYGWEQLAKLFEPDFIKHVIMSRKEVVDGKEWYKLQAHNVIEYFGPMAWASHPAPLEINILIPPKSAL